MAKRTRPALRVAMVTPYWHPIVGGPTTFVDGLAKELRADQVAEVLVLAREGGDPGAVILGGGKREFSRAVVKRLERFRPDVVHAHAHWYALHAALRYRARHPEARVVFTLHTAFPPGSAVRRAGLRRLLSQADIVTAVSLDLLEVTRRGFRFGTRVAVTRPGTTVRNPPPSAVTAYREALNLPTAPLVTFLGQLVYASKGRGLGLLIRAMKRVRAERPQAILVVVGDGPERAALEAEAARTIPGGARFLGAVPDVAPALTATAVYAHISLQEGLPNALLEALACGAPVVASAVGGIPEVIREGREGFLVGEEPAEIAERILRVLRDPALARDLSRAGREAAVAEWSWTAAARRFLPVYGRASGRRRVVITADLERDYHDVRHRHRGMDEGLPKILAMLHRHGIRLHSFATSDLVDGYGDVLRGLSRSGHTLGCHGESHDVEYLSAKSETWQRDMVVRATRALEKATGRRPDTFRAANFSANGATVRALESAGYRVDSSVLPGRLVRRRRTVTLVDFRSAPRDPYFSDPQDPARPGRSGILEVPVTENPSAPGGPIGLGYLNSRGVDATLDAISRSIGETCVFLIHPWEFVEPPEGRVPTWMDLACRGDEARLEAFLARLAREHDVITLADAVKGILPAGRVQR